MKSILTFLLVALLLAFTPASFGSEVGYTVSETPAVSGVPLSTVTATSDNSQHFAGPSAGTTDIYCLGSTPASSKLLAAALRIHKRHVAPKKRGVQHRHLHPRSTG